MGPSGPEPFRVRLGFARVLASGVRMVIDGNSECLARA